MPDVLCTSHASSDSVLRVLLWWALLLFAWCRYIKQIRKFRLAQEQIPNKTWDSSMCLSDCKYQADDHGLHIRDHVLILFDSSAQNWASCPESVNEIDICWNRVTQSLECDSYWRSWICILLGDMHSAQCSLPENEIEFPRRGAMLTDNSDDKGIGCRPLGNICLFKPLFMSPFFCWCMFAVLQRKKLGIFSIIFFVYMHSFLLDICWGMEFLSHRVHDV